MIKLKNKFKKILVTGGTGSFGNEIVKSFLDENNVNQIRIFSRDELKQDEMRKRYKSKKLEFVIGDVRDKETLSNVTKNIDLVFHAAALKQVPSCEFFPDEAVKTNFIGSKNVIESSLEKRVKKIILLSTDKAVEPINAMGMSKALMEKLAISYSKKFDEKFSSICCVRYGNVMTSRGSVIPLFEKQILSGQPVTITHKDMTRFLLFLEDAIDLVKFAANNGGNGEILVKKAPSAKIIDVAKELFKILKKKEKIQVIGIRHGEKIHETLVSENEMIRAKDFGKYFKIPLDTRDLNYKAYFAKGSKIKKNYRSYSSSDITISNTKLSNMLKKLI